MKPIDGTLTSLFRQVMELPQDEIIADLRRGDESVWDSLAHVRLILAIESEFNIEFDLDEAMEFHSLDDILDHLSREL